MQNKQDREYWVINTENVFGTTAKPAVPSSRIDQWVIDTNLAEDMYGNTSVTPALACWYRRQGN